MTSLSREISQTIDDRRAALAERIVERELARWPGRKRRLGAKAREKARVDAGYHLDFLSEAIRRDCAALFDDYVIWARDVQIGRNLSAEDMVHSLEVVASVLSEALSPEGGEVAHAFIQRAARGLATARSKPAFVDPAAPFGDLAVRYLDALLAADRRGAIQLIVEAAQDGVAIADIYQHVLQPAQWEIGRLWQTGQMSVAREHLCTAVTELAISRLSAQVFDAVPEHGTVVATCVAGEHHQVGSRMVADMMQMHGWDTHFLGANVPSDDVVRMVCDTEARIVAVSATMECHVRGVERLLSEVRKAAGHQLVAIVGGAPFRLDSKLWAEVGADGTAGDASQVPDLLAKLTHGSARVAS